MLPIIQRGAAWYATRARPVPIQQVGQPRTAANAMRIAHVAADFDAPDPAIEQMFGGDVA